VTDFKSNIVSLSTRRRVATLVAVIGLLFVASRLANLWPRDVELVYEVGPEVREVDVDYLQAGEAVSSVRFGQSTMKAGVIRHLVRLQPGEYEVHITLYGQDRSATEQLRGLSVPAARATRIDLKAATGSSE
jgi:hypothetical protein